jgi:uncharacterized caspase-like protein
LIFVINFTYEEIVMKQIFPLFAIALFVSGCNTTPTEPQTEQPVEKTVPPSTETQSQQQPTPQKTVIIKQFGDPNSQLLALVIGNGQYAYSPLRNPENDAVAMTDKLVDLGFLVTRATHLDNQAMTTVVDDFKNQLSSLQEEVALFYFSGHGAQLNGQNYLLPVNNEHIQEDNLGQQAISAQNVLAMMREKNPGMNMIVLDACRDNPYLGSEKSATRGLARMAPQRGALIAFAAAPGQPAHDGDGANGLYTSYLLKALDKAEHKRIEDVFMEVREPVYENSSL